MKNLLSRIQWKTESACLFSEQGQLSFVQLNTESDNWAVYLHQTLTSNGDDLPTVMPIVAERSADYILAVLACWKLGLTVVPIAKGTPEVRLGQILADLSCNVVINLTSESATQNAHELRFDNVPRANVALTDLHLTDSDSAYIIYTSGTTGKPKGCVIGDETLEPVVDAFCEYYQIDASSRVTFCSNVAFDAAMMEWLPALFTGASIYVVEPTILLNSDKLVDFYHRHQITFSWLPTPIAELLMTDVQVALPESLKTLQTAGQRLTQRPPANWHTKVENAYGPTETTVIATSGVVQPDGHGLPHIGHALPGVQAVVVDQDLNILPTGQQGELLIAGIGVGRGYLNQPELTNKRFIPLKLSDGASVQAYRTGDICKMNEQGNIEYIARADKQLKVNGFRIESEDVIHQMLQITGVQQAHVKVERIGSSDVLLGYMVLRPEAILQEQQVKTLLADSLPEYMVPQQVMFLDEFPLTENQKLDEQALPLPEANSEIDEDLPPEQTQFLQIFRQQTGTQMGWKSNFFNSGGNSIAAISIAAKVHKQLGLILPFELFEREGTPERLWSTASQNQFSTVEIKSALSDEHEYMDIPLSSSQRSIWFFAKMDNQDRAYHAKSQLAMRGKVDTEAVAYAIQKVVDRHSIFRTAFIPGNGEGLQRVYRNYKVRLTTFDFSHLNEEDGDIALKDVIQEGLNQPFILSKLPLVRWGLVTLAEDYHVLVHIEHHLVHDGWSYNLFLEDFLHYYRAHLENSKAELPFPSQYADYCVAQAQWLKTEQVSEHRHYWEKQLAGSPQKLNMPAHATDTDDPRGGKTIRVKLPRQTWNNISALAEKRGETAFSILLGLYYVILSRFTGDKDICVGSAFANRQWINADSIIGMMINTVVLRGQLRNDMKADELLAHSARVTQEAQKHQSLPFEYLVKALNPSRDPGVNPYFQVFFGFHDSPMPELDIPGVRHSQVYEAIDSRSAKFDLSVVVIPREGQLGEGNPVHMLWEFKTAKLPQWLIETMIQSYLQVLDTVLSDVQQPVMQLPLPSADSKGVKQQINTETVYQRFRQQALANPQNPAIICDGRSSSYQQLLLLAEGKASYLADIGIEAGQFIGLCLPRGVNNLTWMLACQAAGVGYVPLDPDYPRDRIEYIISHSKIAFVVAQDSSLNAKQIQPDANSDTPWQQRDIDPALPMYCLYTSGSTGLPKGVVISYNAFANFITAMSDEFRLQPEHRWLALTSFSFDISTLEIYLPLVSGAQVLLASQQETQDIAQLRGYLESRGVSHCQATPGVWRTLTALGWRPSAEQVILCGGEALDKSLAVSLSSQNNLCFNLYGPTETTVWSSIKRIEPDLQDIPLGRPIANTQFFLLDDDLKPVPTGATGHLWIAGDSLADGYLHSPELTQERFVQHPQLNCRMYHTGDLVALDSSGELHFRGRSDHQIKLSGYRIELDEIEKIIRDIDGVDNCAVVVREIADTQQLVAFVVSHLEEQQILVGCQKYLPAYMHPKQIIKLDALPLTPNKKVDKKALPQELVQETVVNVVQTETESQLAKLYSQYLGLDQVDTQRHFYKLGGNSLMAMRLSVTIEEQFELSMKATDIIQLGTLSAIAAYLDMMTGSQEQEEVAEELTL